MQQIQANAVRFHRLVTPKYSRPESAKHWTKERLAIKSQELGKIICKMNDGKGPESSACAKSKTARLSKWWSSSSNRWPQIRNYPQRFASERGIDCAIIYDSAVFTLVEPSSTIRRRKQPATSSKPSSGAMATTSTFSWTTGPRAGMLSRSAKRRRRPA